MWKTNQYLVPKSAYNSTDNNQSLVIAVTDKGLVLQPTGICLFTYDQATTPFKFRERLFALLDPNTYPIEALSYFSYSDPSEGSVIRLHAFVGSLIGILRDLDIAEIQQPLLVQAQRTLVSGYEQETDHLFIIDTSENSDTIRTLLTYRDIVIKAIKRPHYNKKSLDLIINCASSDYGHVSDFRKMVYDSMSSIHGATSSIDGSCNQALPVERIVKALVAIVDRSIYSVCDTRAIEGEVELMFRKLNWEHPVTCTSMSQPQVTAAGTELSFSFVS